MAKNCTVKMSHSKILIEENKRKATFLNPRRMPYEVSKVDNCLITGGIRCDYLVSEVGSASVLVELKGANVEHACAQLMSSVENANIKPLLEPKFGFLVICSKYPKFDTFVARAKTAAAKKYKSGFHVFSNQRDVEIHKIVEIAN